METPKLYNEHYLKHKETIKANASKYQKEHRQEKNAYQREYRRKQFEAFKKLQALEFLINN